jgi:uncharacterized protein
MQLNLERPTQPNIIRSVSNNTQSFHIVVGETAFTQSVILTSESIDLWEVTNISELETHHFEQLALYPVEVIVLGTGTSIEFPDPALSQALMENHIGLEVMDTVAACRTYNVLAGDGRKVVAALIMW